MLFLKICFIIIYYVGIEKMNYFNNTIFQNEETCVRELDDIFFWRILRILYREYLLSDNKLLTQGDSRISDAFNDWKHILLMNDCSKQRVWFFFSYIYETYLIHILPRHFPFLINILNKFWYFNLETEFSNLIY